MKSFKLIVWVLLLGGVSALHAQQSITGVVTDDSGVPLIGASILAAGTTTGTVTDIDGNFTLSLPESAQELVVSYTGYTTGTVPVTGASNYTITLYENAATLNEVVVTGYGTQTRRRLTTSIASVNSEELKGVPVTDFQNALQGRLPGVTISSNSGSLGSQTSIRVRGIGSINSDVQPLYVVDGVILETNAEGYQLGGPGTSPLSNINPNDIESIDVLKDAASAAIYGSRGSNGVVLITTKSGNYNAPANVSVNQYVGFSNPTAQYDLLSGPEYARYWNQAVLAGGDSTKIATQLYDNPDEEPDANWIDLVTRTGSVAETNASVSGGTSDLSYFLGGGYRDEKGWTEGTSLQRYSFRLNLEQRFGDKWTVGLNLNPTRTVNNRQNEDNNVASPQTFASLFFPNLDPYDENGEAKGGVLSTSTGRTQFAGSPLINWQDQEISLTTNQVIANINASFKPLDNLTFATRFGTQFLSLEDFQRSGVLTTDGYGSGGTGGAQQQSVLNYTWNNTALYNFSINTSEFEVLAGIELNRQTENGFFVDGNTFADDRLATLNSAAEITGGGGSRTESNFVGYFSRLGYVFDNRLFVNVVARLDGSSRFGSDNYYGFFPAVSAAYDFSNDLNTPSVSQLKLRSSYGKTGNAGIGNFASRGLVSFGNDYNAVPGFLLSQLANTELTWETATTFDVAVDFGFFNDKIKGSLGYYNKVSSDLLLDIPQPYTAGISTAALTANAGEIVNQGVEFSLRYNAIYRPDFQLSFNVNGATVDNKVTQLVDNNGDGEPDDINLGNQLIREGEAIGSWYLTEYAGVNPDNGDALFVNADGEISKTYQQGNARQIVGNPLPDFSGGFGGNLYFKGVDLSFFFQAALGHQLYLSEGRFYATNMSSVYNQERGQLNSWRPDNRITDIPEARQVGNGNQHSTRYLSDADFLRLRNVQLGYTFDGLNSNGASLRLYVSGQNLLTFTDFAGLDPEASGQDVNGVASGSLFFSRPQSKLFTFGLNLNL
ncbi:SusC/RagA family TonB-linked outer membrane protein [Lewinella sp. IMCC34183]|uniref:SusC/RagA family TonB-linked outer membrane protein n=1 Tax=Lewinella sp. IMCC34183 TaxID=2248762 RepID=UPI000E24C523|nr:TonB-dependent receptor [Lewinella sp. IMCC34183]